MTEQTKCTKCGQTHVRKATGIVLTETSTSEIPVIRTLDWWHDRPEQRYQYETTRDVTTTSALARMLQPPAFLSKRLQPVDSPEIVRSKLTGAVSSSKYTLWLVLALIWGFLWGSCMFNIIGQAAVTAAQQEGRTYALLVTGVLAGIGFALAWFFNNKNKNQFVDRENLPPDKQLSIDRQVEYAAQRYHEYQTAARQQNLGRERYNRLYYCYTCDGIFDPQDSQRRIYPPNRIEECLFTP